jgi:peptidoglycan/LPS O-acetylase OafA/YrhL
VKINYRPEIDGLRAIAVAAVILYHSQIKILGQQLFKGGFIGVDIFFVISGYLITSIILKELVTTGAFSFKHFYERRVRRILPAILFVMLASLPFAWIYLMPSNLVDFSKSILYSLGFSSNFYFHYAGQEYGGRGGLFIPFLHTWSLSVEEQYYILFPIISFAIFKYLKKYFSIILIAGFIASLVIADWGSRNYPSANFYFLHARMWELLAGSILAYFEIKLGHRGKNLILSLISPGIGLLFIGSSIFFFNNELFHPSFYTLSPIIGVCLIIWFSNKNELTTKILSSKLFVGVGLISYSLYLWHYPVFAFVRNSQLISNGDITQKLLIGLIILFLSIISYFFIEKPSRNKNIQFKFIISKIILVVMLIFSFSIFVIYKDGKINKMNIMIAEQIKSPVFNSSCKYSTASLNFVDDDFFKDDFKNCNQKYKKFILIIGDSHARDLYNSMARISKENEYIISFNKAGCRPQNEFELTCHYLNTLKFIKEYKSQIKYVFFTHKGSFFLTHVGDKSTSDSDSRLRKLPFDERQLENTIKYLNQIKDITNNLILFGPHLEPNVWLNRKILLEMYKNNFSNLSTLDKTNKDLIFVDKKLKEMSKKNNIKYISKIDAIKFDFSKDFVVNSKLTFSDTDHWSKFGEVFFGERLIYNTNLKNILFP